MEHLFETVAAKLLPRLKRHCGLEICRVVGRPLLRDRAPSPPAGIHFGIVNEAQLLPHCAHAELELSERHVREASARGDLCVGAFDGGRLVGYQWLAFRPTPHVGGVWVEFDPRARYSYKKFVHPDYRGQRIAAGLSSHADGLCRLLGRRATVGFIRLDNHASWRASARLGSRTIGYAGYFSLGSGFLAFRSSGARRCGFRFFRPADAATRRRAAGAAREAIRKLMRRLV